MNTPKFTIQRISPPAYRECDIRMDVPNHPRGGCVLNREIAVDLTHGWCGIPAADILRAIDVLEAREAVLRVYPDAVGSAPEMGQEVFVCHNNWNILGRGDTQDDAWLDAAAWLSKEKTPVELARGAVLARYPEAYVDDRSKDWASPWITIYENQRPYAKPLGLGGDTEDDAWLDAAGKLGGSFTMDEDQLTEAIGVVREARETILKLQEQVRLKDLQIARLNEHIVGLTLDEWSDTMTDSLGTSTMSHSELRTSILQKKGKQYRWSANPTVIYDDKDKALYGPPFAVDEGHSAPQSEPAS